MQICLKPFSIFKLNYDYNNKKINYNCYPNLAPLKADTVSFGANVCEFDVFDFAVQQKIGLDFSRFETYDKFQEKCRERLKEYYEKDYTPAIYEGEDEYSSRVPKLFEWFNYLKSEDNDYTPAMKLLIISSITKDLRADNDNEPPKFDNKILAEVMGEIKNKTKREVRTLSFLELYKQKMLRGLELVNDDGSKAKGNTGWIILPSKKSDPKNFKSNVEKLKLLSRNNWCTKADPFAKGYLSRGDFHLYLEEGKPKIAVTYWDDRVNEIQGEKNNNCIPLKYLDIMEKHIENEIKMRKLTNRAVRDIQSAKQFKNKVEEIKKKIGKSSEQALTMEGLLKEFNMLEKRDEDGKFILKCYSQPDENFDWEDLGINEDKLFKNIKEINGFADFSFSKVTNLGNLQSLEYVNFQNSQIKDLGQLKSIASYANFSETKIKNLGQLKSIGGSADFRDSQITDLGQLKFIRGSADFRNSEIKSLGQLKLIAGCASFRNSKIKDLGQLQSIGGVADFSDSKIKDLGQLQSIGGAADFRNSKITDLGNLQSIGGAAVFRDSIITDLGQLKLIGGDADFRNSIITDLGNLQLIGGNADFSDSQITDLGNLQSIGGYADFSDSQITDLGRLNLIGWYINLKNSKLKPSDFSKIIVSGEFVK